MTLGCCVGVQGVEGMTLGCVSEVVQCAEGVTLGCCCVGVQGVEGVYIGSHHTSRIFDYTRVSNLT